MPSLRHAFFNAVGHTPSSDHRHLEVGGDEVTRHKDGLPVVWDCLPLSTTAWHKVLANLLNPAGTRLAFLAVGIVIHRLALMQDAREL
jgi:hypothetical protein